VIQVEVLILPHRIQRDVGHLALIFVGQEGVAEGFLFGVFGKEAGEGVGTDVAIFYVNINDYNVLHN